MANLSDVEDTLVSVVSGILYPNGASNPSVISSVDNIYIYAGWPRPADLEGDAKANNAHVTIFPQGQGRDTTRFRQNWHEQYIAPATIFTSLAGNVVTLTGSVSVPQSVMIVVNGIGYAYQVLIADTLTSICEALALLIPNSTALGETLTINGAFSIIPRVTQIGRIVKEVKRQETVLSVITWTNARDKRTAIADVIEAELAVMERFVLPDNYFAALTYKGIQDHDELQKTYAIYRRDLIFRVEYATTVSMEAYEITSTIENISLVKNI